MDGNLAMRMVKCVNASSICLDNNPETDLKQIETYLIGISI